MLRRTRYLLIIFIFIVLSSISGCKQGDEKKEKKEAASEDKKTEEKEESEEELSLRLSGGQLGSEAIAFIGGGVSNKIWVADAKYHKMVSMIEVTGPKLERTKPNYPNLHDVHAIVMPKDFSQLITVDWYNYDKPSEIISYDPKTFKELWRSEAGLGGHHGALTPDDKFLYIANQYADTVSVIDMATHKKVKDIKTGMGNDYITPTMYWEGKVINSPYMFVTVHDGGKVFAIDWKKHEVVKEITFGGMAHGVNLTPDGEQAWVCVMNKNIVPVIDVNTLAVVKEIKFDQSPIHMSFSPNGKYVYITTTGDQIFKYDTKTYKQVWNVTGTSTPAHTGVSPDGKELWTNNHAMNDKHYPYQLGASVVSGVQVWDTKTGKLINEIPAEGTPHELQFVPYSAVGLSSKKEDGQTDDATAAAEGLYKKSCLACHGVNLEGAAGPNLEKVGDRYSKEEIEHIISHGKGSMPAKLLSDKDAKKVSDWLSQMK